MDISQREGIGHMELQKIEIIENERFSWTWMNPDYVDDKLDGRSIYRGAWMFKDRFGSEPMPEDLRKDWLKFFTDVLDRVEKNKEDIAQAKEITAETGNEWRFGKGWCKCCESYCYGDCRS